MFDEVVIQKALVICQKVRECVEWWNAWTKKGHLVDHIILSLYKVWWCTKSLTMHITFDYACEVWRRIQRLTIDSSAVDARVLSGGESRWLALVSYGYQWQPWVWVHMCGRLTSAISQRSLCLNDVHDNQLSRVSRITKGLLSSTRSAEINESALLINISLREESSGRFDWSKGDIELVSWRKLGSS